MCKWTRIGFVLVLLLAVGAAVWMSAHDRFFRPTTTPAGNIPISLRYFPETNDDGSFVDHPAFWVTNHTDKTLSVNISGIEVRTGSTWTSVPGSSGVFLGSLDFRNARGTTGSLPPHGANYGRVSERLNVPADCVWRAQATVQEQRVGVEDVVARIRLQERLMQIRRSGKTNLPLNAFRRDIATWGAPLRVTSEEVLPP